MNSDKNPALPVRQGKKKGKKHRKIHKQSILHTNNAYKIMKRVYPTPQYTYKAAKLLKALC